MCIRDSLNAYNYARRLKTLSGLTPYEYIRKIWTSEPDRFILNPIHQMPGLNSHDLADLINSHYQDLENWQHSANVALQEGLVKVCKTKK